TPATPLARSPLPPGSSVAETTPAVPPAHRSPESRSSRYLPSAVCSCVRTGIVIECHQGLDRKAACGSRFSGIECLEHNGLGLLVKEYRQRWTPKVARIFTFKGSQLKDESPFKVR